MQIPGYTYITHKLVQRLWGAECRYTVARPDGTHINDVVAISSMKLDEAEIEKIVIARLLVVDVPPETLEPEKTYTEDEVKTLLVEKGYIEESESVDDLKTATEFIESKEAPVDPIEEAVK